jgi:asparagine synthase (glutamine-hydrolysing)
VSGIAAVWHIDGAPLEREGLDRVAARLHPDPADAVGVWSEGPVGLVQRTLHSDLPPPDAYPLRDGSGSVVLVADVRLDNRADLVDELGIAEGDGLGDGALILRAWDRWGEECPERLRGDFAFVLWDARRRVVFCARDSAGMKPLYYHLSSRLFAAASETRPILAVPGVPRRLNEVRIAAVFVAAANDLVSTSFEGILRLPGGHSLTVTERGGALRAHWQPDPARELTGRSDAEYADGFLTLFTSSVRDRLRGSLPVAAALSGGLDSSSVVAVARAIGQAEGRGPVWTYTARFPTVPGCDESEYVSAIVEQGGLSPRGIWGDRLDPLGDLERLPGLEDETFQSPGYYMHGALYRAARDDGARIFLEGTGGDLVVSHGIGYLAGLARAGRWVALRHHLRVAGSARLQGTLARRVAALVAPPGIRITWNRLRYRGVLGQPTLLRGDFARRIALDDRARAVEAIGRGLDLEPARREHWRDLISPRLADAQDALAAWALRMGVELRDPFFDRRLVEYCLSLPADQKVRRDRTRVVMRHAVGPLLPPIVRDRQSKTRLDLMVTAALAAYGRDRVDATMRDAADLLAPYVPPESVRAVYGRYVAAGTGASVGRVWRLATLAIWLRRFLGGPDDLRYTAADRSWRTGQ